MSIDSFRDRLGPELFDAFSRVAASEKLGGGLNSRSVVMVRRDRLRQIISDELVRYFDGSDSVAGVVITEGEVNHLVASIFDRVDFVTSD